MRREFIEALRTNENEFGLALDDTTVERLADYYDLVQQHNPILHLVAPCSPEEFATRHILESLTLLNHLPNGSRFGDVGPGAGLPSIPCLIVRDDLKGVLIESKKKKTAFLELVVSNLLELRRVEVIGLQFEEVRDQRLRIVTCRALDKFVDKMPRLVKWSKGAKLLLFGGNTLRDVLDKLRIEYVPEKMPLSERRFLFVTKNRYRR
jgi:16S rRNA (guanine527-N7)-methyltransferase